MTNPANSKPTHGSASHDATTNSDTSPPAEFASTAAATFCATAVDEWVRAGVQLAFVAPGSRSTPLVLALTQSETIRVEVFHDERAASFAALGFSKATGVPSVLVCTSGTASAHFHAAVIEASLSCVPLIVCTADRPNELVNVSAPQTIDQTKLYGQAVRAFSAPGPAEMKQSRWWRSWASKLVADAKGWSGQAGPVHTNLAFRDPLVGQPGEIPDGRSDGRPWHSVSLQTSSSRVPGSIDDCANNSTCEDEILRLIGRRSGLIICGAETTNPNAVLALGQKLGWPILADHRSGARQAGKAICHADLLLRHDKFIQQQPEVILRFGEIHTSKTISTWLQTRTATVIVAAPDKRWVDPERTATMLASDQDLACRLSKRIEALRKSAGDWQPTPNPYFEDWMTADELAADSVAAAVDNAVSPNEPAIARAVTNTVPDGSAVVLSSSMPVRDVEWFAGPRQDVEFISNRGANGIDGVISTAIGVALTGRKTTVLLGDVAFLHDSTALVGLSRRDVDLHIVVINNDGGGIFSFLPQADALSTDSFEQLFGTPHGSDLEALCSAHSLETNLWPPQDFDVSGVRVTIAETDRAANTLLHHKIVRSTLEALDGA